MKYRGFTIKFVGGYWSATKPPRGRDGGIAVTRATKAALKAWVDDHAAKAEAPP